MVPRREPMKPWSRSWTGDLPLSLIHILFDRFYKGKGGNHGLGLAIARCSLEYMGGSVRAADTQKGAEFEITLPQDCRSFAPDERTEM